MICLFLRDNYFINRPFIITHLSFTESGCVFTFEYSRHSYLYTLMDELVTGSYILGVQQIMNLDT